MNDIRKHIQIVETSKLDEVYSENNSAFKRYMQNAEFDPYSAWYEVCEWLERHDYLEEVSQLLGHEVASADDLQEEEPEVFYKLPADVQKRCAEEATEVLMRRDPSSASTHSHMMLNKDRLLHRTTWLVHFTDSPYDISAEGFKIGMDNMDRLGLTTWFKNDGFDKKYGGYNFAFIANGRDAINAASAGKYGRSAVLFQNSGVHCYHYGDDEDQVVFWGADVSPNSIIMLLKNEGAWRVYSHYRLGNGSEYLFTGDYEECVNWVMKNQQQYRRYLYRR